MEQARKRLEVREQELMCLKMEKEKALREAPEGKLRISTNGKRVQYYLREGAKDTNGTYIRGENMELVRRLAQKDYDQKVLRVAEKELNAIKKFLSDVPKEGAEDIFENLHKERQKLIVPVAETDAQFVENWEQVEYRGKGFSENTTKIYTFKGERVRSKSEVIIADALNREGVPYRYEYPVYLPNIGNVYPDFLVLNIRLRKEFYWEHLGMMDEAEYAEKAVQKIISYEQNGIYPGENLILTYETKKNPISSNIVCQMIQKYLK